MSESVDDPQLGPTQSEVYEVLDEAEEPLTRGQIGDRTRANSNAAGQALDRLRKLGHVSHREGPGGKYLYRIAGEGGDQQ
ncbi:hypothetical protein [Natrinema pallidum]|uniref:hypothetical protein n=1 Tax=Natrinema pallidum TaxID=69527 RepID=UPI00375289CC